MGNVIRETLDRIEAKRAALPPAEREELERLELEAQRESWIRSMAPCKHGVLDWEECGQCRSGSIDGGRRAVTAAARITPAEIERLREALKVADDYINRLGHGGNKESLIVRQALSGTTGSAT